MPMTFKDITWAQLQSAAIPALLTPTEAGQAAIDLEAATGERVVLVFDADGDLRYVVVGPLPAQEG